MESTVMHALCWKMGGALAARWKGEVGAPAVQLRSVCPRRQGWLLILESGRRASA